MDAAKLCHFLSTAGSQIFEVPTWSRRKRRHCPVSGWDDRALPSGVSWDRGNTIC